LRGEAPRQDQDEVALPAYPLHARRLIRRGRGLSRSRVRPAPERAYPMYTMTGSVGGRISQPTEG
jgi:hypothetical protein